MAKALTLFDTTIGKKIAVAFTGLILYGFVLIHMLGNLQIFLGPKAYNHYAAMLRAVPELLWVARLVLIVCFVSHIALTVSLASRTQGARRVGYRKQKLQASTFAARSMLLTGPILLFFVIIHLVNFTYPGVIPGGHFSETNVYGNVTQAFQALPFVALYVFCNAAIGFHLYHGSWSLFQSLGLSHSRYDKPKKRIAQALGLAVAAGNIIMPLAVFSGVLPQSTADERVVSAAAQAGHYNASTDNEEGSAP